MTILCIAIALTLITVMFTLFSSYFKTMRNLAESIDPWHCEINGLTKEQADSLAQNESITDMQFTEKENDDTSSITRINFKKNIGDADETVKKALLSAGVTENEIESEDIGYYLNDSLLKAEFIGDDAKFSYLQTFAIFYIVVLFLIACCRLVIDTSFEISSKDRIKQFGILRSIGATKKQIVSVMTWEGVYLSIVGIPLGILSGYGVSYLICRLILSTKILEVFGIKSNLLTFGISLPMVAVTAVTGLVWVMLSAYGTGMRVVKKSPVDAIRFSGEKVKKVSSAVIGYKIFGLEGKLAERNVLRSRKRYIITCLSIILSITLAATFKFVIESYGNDIIASLNEDSQLLLEDGEIELYGNFSICADGKSLKRTVVDTDIEGDDGTRISMDYEKLRSELQKTGYFKDIRPNLYIFGQGNGLAVSDDYKTVYDDTENLPDNVRNVNITFLDQENYERLFSSVSDKPSYDDFKDKGVLVMSYVADDNTDINPVNTADCTSFTVTPYYGTVAEWNNGYSIFDDDSDNSDDNAYSETIEIAGTINSSDNPLWQSSNHTISMVASEEYFKKLNGGSSVIETESYGLDILASIKNDDTYADAKNYIEHSDKFSISGNIIGEQLKAKRTMSAVKIFGYSVISLIILTALINIINIISTGISDRRGEIAMLRSVGMTKRQMYKMLMVESGNYAVTAGLFSLILTMILVYLTLIVMGLMDVENLGFDIFKPMITVPIATLATFITAMVSTLIAIKRSGNENITETIKNAQ
jgi:putative ABC transport system permease protein